MRAKMLHLRAVSLVCVTAVPISWPLCTVLHPFGDPSVVLWDVGDETRVAVEPVASQCLDDTVLIAACKIRLVVSDPGGVPPPPPVVQATPTVRMSVTAEGQEGSQESS